MWASKGTLIAAAAVLLAVLAPLPILWLQARSIRRKNPEKARELRSMYYIAPAAMLIGLGLTFTKSWISGHGMSVVQFLSGLPVGAVDAATYQRYSTAASEFEMSGGHVRGFRVTCAKRMALTDADLANGHQSKWCLMVAFIYRSQGDSTWHQAPPEAVVVASTHGVWSTPDDQPDSAEIIDCGCK